MLVAGYVEQYNGTCPHQSLSYETPSEWYYSGWLPPRRQRYRTRAHFQPKISCPNGQATL